MAGIPQLDFDHFSIKEMKRLWDNNKILINEEYQRSEIWKPYQRRDLIESIMKGFSMGVLVVWKNKDKQFEILDGQQRIKTIIRFLNDEFKNNNNKKFSELTVTEQSEIDGYSIYYLDLKSSLREEQVSDIFTRLQEGTPLTIAEKVNAFHGAFRKGFIEAFIKNWRFFGKIKNRRFRARLLSAQFLLLELETDFDRNIFPNMKYNDFKSINEKYKGYLPKKKFQMYNTYINFLGTFLYGQLRAISPRDLISLYLLASYLHKKQAKVQGFGIYFQRFVTEFMKNLTSFSIYDTSPPRGVPLGIFRKYKAYKEYARMANTAEAIEKKFKFVLSEYKQIFPSIKFKDKTRLFNEEQKIQIYFKQKALCAHCKKPLDFSSAECHHKKEHSKGGPTKIFGGQMVHHRCHEKIHKKRNRTTQKGMNKKP